MRWEIEQTGCCERKGMLQIKVCFYLDPEDDRYEEHHINVPVIPEGGYAGSKDKDGQPISVEDFDTWRDSLPKKWQTNPFHNHFIRVRLDATSENIAAIADKLLPQFYGKWKNREELGGGTWLK